MSHMTRRKLFSLMGTGAVGLTIAPLTAYAGRAQANAGGVPAFGPGFGGLTPKYPTNMAEMPANLQDIAFITLPEGFEYSVISTTSELLHDGNPVPGAHDGMGAFRGPRGTTILVRNHELRTSSTPVVAPGATYNPTMAGGNTNLVIDPQGRLIDSYGSLAGTERNCAGGPTPWGTWLSCEETFANRNGIAHGYVFEVPSNGISDAVPLRGLGRFNHEAAAVDPHTGYVYLTEDRGDSLLYRFRPASYGDLRSPGQLEALRLVDWPSGVNTRRGFLGYIFDRLPCDWVPIDDFDPASDTCRAEGQSKGAATFSRGEGCWYGNGLVYFACTNGGDIGRGQIFAYDPARDTLTLFVESIDADELKAPDNLCVGPDGRLYLFEDASGPCNVVGVNHDGELFRVAENIYNGSEWAGGCFSHDGRFMFVNLQSPGLTLVIRGPWRKGQR